MLSEIYIRNYILVPELRLPFKPGLTVITGETGAGKSILVGSIGIIFGDNPAGLEAWDKSKPIYLEATFRLKEDDELLSYLKSIAGEDEEELLLAREISKNGKSAYFIGGRKVNASVMKGLKPLLLDFHHQRDQQKILAPAYQLLLLDRYAGCLKLREDYRSLWRELKRLKTELDDMIHQREEQSRMIELYRYQYAELESANLKPGEEYTLQKEYELLSHSMDILQMAQSMNESMFESENSIFDQISHFSAQINHFRELNPAISNAAQSLGEALEALNSTSFELSQIMDSISADPLRLTEIEDRLDLINSLLHKHKVKSVEDLQQLFSHREREILVAQDFDKAIDTTRKKLENGELELTDKANELSAARNDAAAKLSQELQTSIRKLAMQDARFEIRIDKNHKAENLKSDALSALSILSETGQDTVEYLFSANPGSDLKSLSAVASGGEMSRILLGIKEVLVNKESARLLVLDEIDSGIGGKTADNVATCIAGIAQRHPVLCITHLAQIAAVADTHIAVNKDADSKTSVTLQVLSPAQRIPEIARMLSGDASNLALKHAEELINKH